MLPNPTNQYIALFIFTYFAGVPLLAMMSANVEANHRTELWRSLEGWIILISPGTRLLIATVTTGCAFLGGVFHV